MRSYWVRIEKTVYLMVISLEKSTLLHKYIK